LPVGTPINTPINTPERSTSVANSFSALQADSDAEDKSVDTINAEEPQIEIESETDDVPITVNPPEEFQPSSRQSFNPASTPEEMKDSDKSTGPIAAIPPTDLERLRESVPIFASTLAKSAGKLFEDLDPQTSEVPSDDLSHIHARGKIPPVASLPTKMSCSMSPQFPDKIARSPYFNSWKGPKDDDDRKLAEDIFGDDSKPPAVTKQPPPLRSPITFQAQEIHLSAETVKPPASDMENDVVDKLNQQIASKQAQLEKLHP
jgi:hypothetical protein